MHVSSFSVFGRYWGCFSGQNCNPIDLPPTQVEEDPRTRGSRGRGVSALPIETTESTTPTALRGAPPRFRGTPTPSGNRARSKPTAPDSIHSGPYQTDFEKDPSEILQVGLRGRPCKDIH